MSPVKLTAFTLGQVGMMMLARFFFQWILNFAASSPTQGDETLFSAAAVGTTLLAFRVFDGVTDPLAGMLGDAWSRKGRPRQQLLWAAFLIPSLGVGLTFAPTHAMEVTSRWALLLSGMFVFFVGYTFYASSIVYRSDLVQINSWKDLLSPELAGRVALPNITGTQGPLTLFMLSKALGHQGYGFEETIDSIGAQADDIVTFYVRSSQLAQLMNQEEVIAAPVGRFAWSRFSNSPLPFVWANPKEGQTGGMNVMIMTKGNGNEELAYQFMDYWLSVESQTRIANAKIDSPANKKVTVSDEVAEGLTYGAELIDSLNIISPADIIDNREGWVERWNTKVIK